MEEEIKPMGRCRMCGKEFEPYKSGAYLVKHKCWPCVRATKEVTRQKKISESDKPASNNGDLLVLIDFADYPGWLQALREQASSEFRTIQGQMMWLIKQGEARGP